VWHVTRPVLKARFPVHVTWKMTDAVWSLRSRRSFGRLRVAFYSSARKFGYRIVHYAVMGNHVHLLVEAADERALSTGMRSLGIRIALTLNRMMGRKGRVLADRYHGRILKTPTEVTRCLTYLRTNAAKHYGTAGADAFASAEPFMRPRTWLLRQIE
jgi:putative transposase